MIGGGFVATTKKLKKVAFDFIALVNEISLS
jgi:hypothetical protein